MEQIIGSLTKIGRFLLAIPMAVFGVLHFMAADNMAPMVPIPGGVIWVYVTGVALIAAAVSAINFMPRNQRAGCRGAPRVCLPTWAPVRPTAAMPPRNSQDDGIGLRARVAGRSGGG